MFLPVATARAAFSGEYVRWISPVCCGRAGPVSEYSLHQGLVNSLFAPGSTNVADGAHFMCELVTNPKAWADGKGKLPVIINAEAPGADTP